MQLTEISRTQAYTTQTMNGPVGERAGISPAIVTQVARAVRPAIAVAVVVLTLWAMPGLEPVNRDVAAHVATAVTR